jgi:hypothetical protein
MMVGDGLAARPIPAAKYEFRQCWRALRALIGVALLTTGTLAFSSGARPATAATPGEARSGTLILKNTDENSTDATRLGIDVDVTVSGPTLRARITQVFRNTTNDWVEAIYVYPLPDGGAVDTLKMVIGDRVVVGGIKERQQARAVYEQAKQNVAGPLEAEDLHRPDRDAPGLAAEFILNDPALHAARPAPQAEVRNVAVEIGLILLALGTAQASNDFGCQLHWGTVGAWPIRLAGGARRPRHKAALTEQQRPNIFTNSVANVGPGETVLVQIEYSC